MRAFGLMAAVAGSGADRVGSARLLRTAGLRVRTLTAALLTCSLTACTSWRVQSLTPQRVVAEKRPQAAFVQGSNRSGVVLQGPFIRNDSILGFVPSLGKTVGFRLADVTSIEVREPDAGKSLALAGGIIGGIALFVYIGVIAILNDPGY